MKRRATRRRQTKRQRRSVSKRRRQRISHRGGANLPVPRGSVISVELDSKDPYDVPIFISKEQFEEEILERD